MSDWVDADGYPTEAALKRIENWDYRDNDDDWHGFLEFVLSLWWAKELLWREERTRDSLHERDVDAYYLSTGGWSGNECLIGAMKKNFFFWRHWVQSRRGGHFVFYLELPKAHGQSRLA